MFVNNSIIIFRDILNTAKIINIINILFLLEYYISMCVNKDYIYIYIVNSKVRSVNSLFVLTRAVPARRHYSGMSNATYVSLASSTTLRINRTRERSPFERLE